MFGTKVEFKRGEWQSACPGDSGGPLMYQTPGSDRWVLIGKLELKLDYLYNCISDLSVLLNAAIFVLQY